MAYPYGTGSGVTFMKKTAKTDKHFFIKGAMVLFLVIYLGTLYNSDNARNIPVEQIAQVQKLNNQSLDAAKIVIAMIPVLAVYPFLQKYFVTGITLGSVKG